MKKMNYEELKFLPPEMKTPTTEEEKEECVAKYYFFKISEETTIKNKIVDKIAAYYKNNCEDKNIKKPLWKK